MTRVCIARFGYVHIVVPVEVVPYLGRMVVVEPTGYRDAARYELDKQTTHDFTFVDVNRVHSSAIDPQQVPNVEVAA